MTMTLTLTLNAEQDTVTLRHDKDAWRWYDGDSDMEISGATPRAALDALYASQGASSVDGDVEEHIVAAERVGFLALFASAAEAVRYENAALQNAGLDAFGDPSTGAYWVALAADKRQTDLEELERAQASEPNGWRAATAEWRERGGEPHDVDER